jgi:beta-N-acetylhexosaminidase
VRRYVNAMSTALAILRFAAALALAAAAYDWRTPMLANVRPFVLAGLLVLLLVLIAAEAWTLLRARRGMRPLRIATLTIASLVLIAITGQELHFRWIKHAVLNADRAELERLGGHFIVGYRDRRDLRRLIERRAVAGVFLTRRNIEGLTTADIRRRVDEWQALRQHESLPPLWIASDQEGGIVSRMSPPLPRMPPLSKIVSAATDEQSRAFDVRNYGREQGRGLAGIGVNLNLAPVVDLNHGLVNPDDRFSRISSRAISRDPNIVASVTTVYCAGLLESGVHCTPKHFPGLGRVFEDTHRDDADLTAPIDELERTDWVPFRALMADPDRIVMLGHARLVALDPRNPASFSRRVVGDLVRGAWQFGGALVTDDFSMGAVYKAPGGVPEASVAALQAGVDLILISFDPDQYYFAMHRLLDAVRSGELPREMLDRSAVRLQHVRAATGRRSTAAAPSPP